MWNGRRPGPFSRVLQIAIASSTIVLGCAGEPRTLPPREPPTRMVPPVPLPPQPIPPGNGRLVIDATDGPMRVAATYDPTFSPPGGQAQTARSGELCTTPCVVDLPKGKYRLFFSATQATDAAAGDADDVRVDEGVQIYRRAPGRYQTPSPTDEILPAVALGASLVAIVAGGGISATNQNNRTGGALLLGVGIAGTIGSSIWIYDTSRATQQDGAGTFFRVDH